MAKTSSIPRHRNAYRSTQGPRQAPSSPSKSNGSLKLLTEQDSDSEDDQDGQDDQDDQDDKLTSKTVIGNHVRHPERNDQQQPETSLWIFEERQSGATNKLSLIDSSMNLLGGVTAPWDLSAIRDQNQDFLGAERSTFVQTLKVTTRTKTPVKKRPLSSAGNSLLSPTHKLLKDKSSKKHKLDLSSGTASGSMNDKNLNSNAPRSLKTTRPLAPSDLNILNNQTQESDMAAEDSPTDAKTDTQDKLDSAVSTEYRSNFGIPPSAIKKNTTLPGVAPKSNKRARFVSSESHDKNHLATVSVQRSAIGQPGAPNSTLPDGPAGPQDVTDSFTVPIDSEYQTATRVVDVFSSKDAASPDLLNSPPPKSLPAPLSPDRPLASRLQSSRPRTSSKESTTFKGTSTVPRSVQTITSNDQVPQDWANAKSNILHAPLASFQRVSRKNSSKCKPAPVAEGRPTGASSVSFTTDLLKPTRIVRKELKLSPDKNFLRINSDLDENSAQRVTTVQESSMDIVPVRDTQSQIPSSALSAVENSPQSSALSLVSTSSDRPQTVDSASDSQQRAESQTPQRNLPVKPKSLLTNRVHVSELGGRKLSTLLELPTPESTLEHVPNAQATRNSFETTDLSILSRKAEGAPNCSTPYQTGPISLPLPPDTIHLSASRPRSSARRVSGRFSPLKAPMIVPLDMSNHFSHKPQNSQIVTNVSKPTTVESTDNTAKATASQGSKFEPLLQKKGASRNLSAQAVVNLPRSSLAQDSSAPVSASSEPKSPKPSEPSRPRVPGLQPSASTTFVVHHQAASPVQQQASTPAGGQLPSLEKRPEGKGIITGDIDANVRLSLVNQKTSSIHPSQQKDSRRREAELQPKLKLTSVRKVSSSCVSEVVQEIQSVSASSGGACEEHGFGGKQTGQRAPVEALDLDENVVSKPSKPSKTLANDPDHVGKTLVNHKRARKESRVLLEPRQEATSSKVNPDHPLLITGVESPPTDHSLLAGPSASTKVQDLASKRDMPWKQCSGGQGSDSGSRADAQNVVVGKSEVLRHKQRTGKTHIVRKESAPENRLTGGKESQRSPIEDKSGTEVRSNKQAIPPPLSPQLRVASVGLGPAITLSQTSESQSTKRDLPPQEDSSRPSEKPNHPSKKAKIPLVKPDSNPKQQKDSSHSKLRDNPSERKTSASVKASKQPLPASSSRQPGFRKPSSDASLALPPLSKPAAQSCPPKNVSRPLLSLAEGASSLGTAASNILLEKSRDSATLNPANRERSDGGECAGQGSHASSQARESVPSPGSIADAPLPGDMRERRRNSHSPSEVDEGFKAAMVPFTHSESIPKIEVIDLVSPCAKQTSVAAGRFTIELESPSKAERVACRLTSVRRVSPVPTYPAGSTAPAPSERPEQDHPLPAKSAPLPLLTLPKEFNFTVRSGVERGERMKDRRDKAVQASLSDPKASRKHVAPSKGLRGAVASRDKPNVRSREEVADGADQRAVKRTRFDPSVPAPARPPLPTAPSRPRGTAAEKRTGGRVQTAIRRLNQTIDRPPQPPVPVLKRSLPSRPAAPVPVPAPTSRQLAAGPSKAMTALTKNCASVPAEASATRLHTRPVDQQALIRSKLMNEIREKNRAKTLESSAVDLLKNVACSDDHFVPLRTAREKGKQKAVEDIDEAVFPAQNIDGATTFGAANQGLSGSGHLNRSAVVRQGALLAVGSKMSGDSQSMTHKPTSGAGSASRPIPVKDLPGSSTAFKKCLDQWREAESRQASSAKLRPGLPEWQDVSMVHHLLPVKQPPKQLANVVEFGLATERRMKERENREQSRIAKERHAQEVREMEEVREREREREELVRLRRERIVKANPIPNYLKRCLP